MVQRTLHKIPVGMANDSLISSVRPAKPPGRMPVRRFSSLCARATSGPQTEVHNGVLIVGAGIGGLATAVALQRAGIDPLVVESAKGPRRGGSAIGLWSNAFRSLEALGVADAIRDQHPRLNRIELCSQDGETLRAFSFEECNGGPHEFRGVRRSNLLDALAAQVPPGAVRYGAGARSLEVGADATTVTLEDGTEIRSRVVVGADGARSAVASSVGLAEPILASYSAYRGIAEFPDGLPVPQTTIRQVWGKGVRAGLYPISKTECYWFVCFNTSSDAEAAYSSAKASASTSTEPDGDKTLADWCREDAAARVRGWEFGVAETIERTPSEEITRSRIADRVLLPGLRYGKRAVTMVGDAAHPITPNLGQGGCLALEDAVLLAQELKVVWPRQRTGWAQGQQARIEAALGRFETQRVSRFLPLALRSNAMGQLLQLNQERVCDARNFFVRNVFSPAHFLDHTQYFPGSI